MYCVILCGGSGTRLWPLSRKNFPKQFLSLYSDKSLLQETYLRMRGILDADRIYFVTNEDNHFNVYNQIRDIEGDYPAGHVIVEPASRNTAPAIALAVKYLLEKAGAAATEPVVFLPADHYIRDADTYLKLIRTATAAVGANIGTIGVTPTKPETGYGYIRKGPAEGKFTRVLEFKEKPDAPTAQRYLASGEYVWNSGMYIFAPQAFLAEAALHAPQLHAHVSRPWSEFIAGFKDLPADAIDTAISEKSANVVLFEAEFGWNDIGSFDSLAEIIGETAQGHARHIAVDSHNVFVHSPHDKLVATLGVDDIIVVENNDSILIQKRGRSEDVKQIVQQLQARRYKEIEHNLVVHRPWGKFEVLIEHPNHKVKKIIVYPGARLSLQSHLHRAEHWVVVKGTAKVTNGERIETLQPNESTFIPAMTMHRLENPGRMNLELIEVQTGDYLEEDDIERFTDDYKRG
jgi:mannose-1-phosphate guanylyltransferase/mannose-6-phosphate isomerase